MIAATIQPGPGMKAHTAAATPAAAPAAKATLPAQMKLHFRCKSRSVAANAPLNFTLLWDSTLT